MYFFTFIHSYFLFFYCFFIIIYFIIFLLFLSYIYGLFYLLCFNFLNFYFIYIITYYFISLFFFITYPTAIAKIINAITDIHMLIVSPVCGSLPPATVSSLLFWLLF